MANHISSRPDGFDTEEDLQSHLASLEESSSLDPLGLPGHEEKYLDRRTMKDVQNDIAFVRDELAQIRDRLASIAGQAENAVRFRAQWADASAHAQLGDYPWLKLAGTMAGAFFATRLLRRLPLGPLITASVPLAAAAIQQRIAK